MQFKRWMIYASLIILLSGCTSENAANEPNDNEYSVLQTKNSPDQSPANEVKRYINDQKDFNEMYAVNSDTKIVIAIEPKHHDRFQLEDFRKSIEKNIKDEAKPLKLEISTDKKIALELKELEERLKSKALSNKELDKELDRIIKLSKEQNLNHK